MGLPGDSLIKLADKKFSLGMFALGVTLIIFGIRTNPDAIKGMSHSELLMLAWLGAAFTVLSAWVWVKSNDYKAKAHELEVEVKKLTLDKEIKSEQAELQIKQLDLASKQLELQKKQLALEEARARNPGFDP